MRPQYSQSNRENVTPSSGTFPLASYKEVSPTPPPPPRAYDIYPMVTINQSSLILLKWKVEC